MSVSDLIAAAWAAHIIVPSFGQGGSVFIPKVKYLCLGHLEVFCACVVRQKCRAMWANSI